MRLLPLTLLGAGFRPSEGARFGASFSYEESRFSPPQRRPAKCSQPTAQSDQQNSKILRRRAEWWRLYHGDPSGVVSSDLRVQAIAHAEKLAAGGLDNPDPGGARPSVSRWPLGPAS